MKGAAVFLGAGAMVLALMEKSRRLREFKEAFPQYADAPHEAGRFDVWSETVALERARKQTRANTKLAREVRKKTLYISGQLAKDLTSRGWPDITAALCARHTMRSHFGPMLDALGDDNPFPPLENKK